MKFYKCHICGNLVELQINGGGELVCCGQPMEELVVKETEEGNEKHLPVVTADGDYINVKIGEVEHTMTDAHYIQLIMIYYNNKAQRVKLNPTDKPEASFKVDEAFESMEVYEYCNIHGLWKTNYKKL